MLSAPAAERNKDPILDVLKANLNESQPLKILEIASGTGQHVAHFAKYFTNFMWQPSDADTKYFKSISSYASMLPKNNVLDPVHIDVSHPIENWDGNVTCQKFDAIYCSNLIHISPYQCTIGLFTSASKLLKPSTGLLITYGPYSENGCLVPESNVRFDEGLRMQNPEWGVRDIVDLVKLGEQNGLCYCNKVEMPANNKMLFFRRNSQQ
ncbi:unnamed protein product [Orchesella dallaii]|uniref:Methyltransferase-like 26 n=1 Tax=Orchesella dallaii TaxID=48710 RepID=A0ABP1RE13_9HEXA